MITYAKFATRSYSWLFVATFLGLFPAMPAATSISQYGITWTFAADMTTGQFVNGDYWVVGPVTITSISPGSTISAGRTINGSMINPIAGISISQGFDSSMTANTFSAALNAGRPGGNDLSAGNSLVVPVNSSLVSSISHPTAGNRPQLTDAAILTVLASPPPANAFRPPYCGSNKAIIATEANLDYSKVAALPKPSSAPNLSTVAGYFTRPWIEIHTQLGGREMHPSNNEPNYGRDLSKRLIEGLLSLQLDYTNSEKRILMIRLVQYGLDVYGSAVTGGFWQENGGHNQGRKMPLLLAATVLNNSSIRFYGNASVKNIFQEDRQTFYVSQAVVDMTNSTSWKPDVRNGPAEPYTTADIGMPEWGILHTKDPRFDNKAWSAIYRTISGSATIGHILTAHIMGLRSTWNWEPAFDYYDRYWEIEKNTTPGTNTPSQFERDMWIAYRNYSLSPPASKAPTITTQPTNSTITAGSSVSFTITASGTAPLNYQWRLNGANISGATSATYTIASATTGQAGTYSAVVSNATGSATSNDATLIVNMIAAPVILSQPTAQSAVTGANITLAISADGTAPLSYQWRKNAVNISGATASSLTITNASAGDAATYSVIVSNPGGATTSANAVVTVNAPAATSPTILSQPAGQTVATGASIVLSVSADGTAPLAYQWRKNAINIAGANAATLNISNAAVGDSATYSITVSNNSGSITSADAIVTVNPPPAVPPTISAQPASVTIVEATAVSFTVSASGTAPFSYQWRVNGVDIAGATSASYTILSVTLDQAGNYSAVVTNTSGSVTSNDATLTVSAKAPPPPSVLPPASAIIQIGVQP